MPRRRRDVIVRLAYVLIALVFYATPAASEPLKVVTAGSSPFITHNGEPGGISAEVWKKIAGELGRETVFSEAATINDALSQVAEGKADVAVGPISITSKRARSVAFTQPYFEASLSILSPSSVGVADMLGLFISKEFVSGLTTLLLVLLVVGTAVWFAERRRNTDQFPADVPKGIASGIWFAIVTMTTVGYGDKAPQSGAGRFLTAVWMLVSLVFVSSFTAFITTTFTLSKLNASAVSSAEELGNHRIAVVGGTTAEGFAREHGARLIKVTSLSEAVEAVANNEADAAVADRPLLQYYLRSNPSLELSMSEASYAPQGYGFAVALEQANLRHQINIALLHLQETKEVDKIVDSWLK